MCRMKKPDLGINVYNPGSLSTRVYPLLSYYLFSNYWGKGRDWNSDPQTDLSAQSGNSVTFFFLAGHMTHFGDGVAPSTMARA